MSLTDFTGQRKLTIRDNTSTGTPKFVVFPANKLSASGLETDDAPNEVKMSTFSGDYTFPNGVSTKAGTLSVIPLSVADMGVLFPAGWDATTASWGMPTGGCDSLDVDIVLEKVCPDADGVSRGNWITKHAQLSPAFKTQLNRDDVFEVAVSFYKIPTLGSEYGIAGAGATETFLQRMFDGTYDPTTGTVTYATT